MIVGFPRRTVHACRFSEERRNAAGAKISGGGVPGHRLQEHPSRTCADRRALDTKAEAAPDHPAG